MARARSVFLSAYCLVGVDQQNPENRKHTAWVRGDVLLSYRYDVLGLEPWRLTIIIQP